MVAAVSHSHPCPAPFGHSPLRRRPLAAPHPETQALAVRTAAQLGSGTVADMVRTVASTGHYLNHSDKAFAPGTVARSMLTGTVAVVPVAAFAAAAAPVVGTAAQMQLETPPAPVELAKAGNPGTRRPASQRARTAALCMVAASVLVNRVRVYHRPSEHSR